MLNLCGNVIVQPKLILARMGLDCRYTSVTRYSAKLCGFKNENSMVGATAFDLRCPTVESAAFFYAQDQRVLIEKKPLAIFSINEYSNGQLLCLKTTKTPITSRDNIIGLEAHCQELPESIRSAFCSHLYQYAHFLLQRKKFKSLTYELVNSYDDYDLTTSESKVLFLLCYGKSVKTIAALFNRSERTIETHLNNIKQKLQLHSKAQVVEFALFTGLCQKMPVGFQAF